MLHKLWNQAVHGVCSRLLRLSCLHRCQYSAKSYPRALDVVCVHSIFRVIACNCDSFGSKGLSCDGEGVCSCYPNFVDTKCGKCAPKRYNYPLCEECNCNPQGVTEDFFSLGGCENVPEGTLCTCKAQVTGRICDTCKPLYWNLQLQNIQGCEGQQYTHCRKDLL